MKTFLLKMGNLCFPFFICAIFLFSSCASEEKNTLFITSTTTFDLLEKEKEKSKKAPNINEYESIITDLGINNTPLYKYIDHPQYHIFIGKVLKSNDSIKEDTSKKSLDFQFNDYYARLFNIEIEDQKKFIGIIKNKIPNENINNSHTYENFKNRFKKK